MFDDMLVIVIGLLGIIICVFVMFDVILKKLRRLEKLIITKDKTNGKDTTNNTSES